MGDFVVGIDATVMCPHGGTATFVPSNTRVMASNVPVAVQTDVTMVAGCPMMVGPSPAPCIMVQWITAAVRVKVNGIPALIKSSVGMTTGPVPGPANIVSTQTRVTAT